MSKLDWVVAFIIGGGLLLILLAAEKEIYGLVTLGLITLGIGLLGGSITAVIKNRVGFWTLRWGRLDSIQGVYSGFLGLILFLSSVILMILAVERMQGQQAALFNLLMQRPGIVLLVGGLIPIVAGIPQVFTPINRQAKFGVIVNQTLRRLRGLALLLLGVGMGLVGMYEFLFPNVFGEFIRTVLGPLAPLWLVQ